MTCFRLFVLILVAGAASASSSSSRSARVVSNSNTADASAAHGGSAMAAQPATRWDRGHGVSNARESVNVNVEDYGRFDPVPSSRATIKSGPIEHGAPLLPYIRRRPTPPPVHPKPMHGFP